VGLRCAHPYLVASEAAAVLFSPNDWMKQRIDALGKRLGQAPEIAIHIRRGDKLTAHGKEAITLSPASELALTIGRIAMRNRLESALLLSDDDDIAHDLAALLPQLRWTSLRLPAMTAARNTSARHRVLLVRDAPLPRSHTRGSPKWRTSLDQGLIRDTQGVIRGTQGRDGVSWWPSPAVPGPHFAKASIGDAGTEPVVQAGLGVRSLITPVYLEALASRPPCGLPSVGGRAALPHCGALGAWPAPIASPAMTSPPMHAAAPQVQVLNLTAGAEAVLSGHLTTAADDLGALLLVAMWHLASARIIVASSASNVGSLLLTLHGFRGTHANGRAGVHFEDTEASSDARPRFERMHLDAGLYFCRLDWANRKFGLCRAGEQRGRPSKPW